MPIEVERELLRKCRAGDWEAYEPIVRAYEGRLFGLAIGIVHNADDARDNCTIQPARSWPGSSASAGTCASTS